jgi:hypothetical protein
MFILAAPSLRRIGQKEVRNAPRLGETFDTAVTKAQIFEPLDLLR